MSVKERLAMGQQITKGPLTLPATATSTLFTVAGGAAFINGLLGRVTTACGATVTTVSLGTGLGGTSALATATAVTSKGVGTWLFAIASAGVGGALQVLGPSSAYLGGTNFPNMPQWPPSFLAQSVQAPDIITWTTSATDTGAVQWYIWWEPIDAGVSVS